MIRFFTLTLLFASATTTATLANDNGNGNRNETPKTKTTTTRPAARWQKEEDQIGTHISHSQLTKMKTTTDALAGMLQGICFADSTLTPIWHGEYTTEKAIG